MYWLTISDKMANESFSRRDYLNTSHNKVRKEPYEAPRQKQSTDAKALRQEHLRKGQVMAKRQEWLKENE